MEDANIAARVRRVSSFFGADSKPAEITSRRKLTKARPTIENGMKKPSFIMITAVLCALIIELFANGIFLLSKRFKHDVGQGDRTETLGKIWGADKSQIITRSESLVRNQLHPYLAYAPIPNQHFPTLNINDDGARGPDFRVKKLQGTTRIVLLGGSVAFGIGASDDEHTIAGYLGQLLNTDPIQKFEVINFGFKGYVTRQEVLLFITKVLRLDPDYVI